ncbi:hypothetical protein BDN70DRAFT_897467 [Pholiota conissans]|uniref:Uncharacterized protein n=1 Tax=Pholiota conissans TaxID=109636 RepID=A0A9P5YV79_9AGAR|nr:hypothetical protein BDN70DRAFT_897467 [Pholiota conissans]
MSNTNSTPLHDNILQAGLTVDGEKSMIAANLDSSIFLAFLMGMLTFKSFEFVDNGATRDTIFLNDFGGQFIIAVLLSVLNVISFVLGDVLLIHSHHISSGAPYDNWDRKLKHSQALLLAQTIGFSIAPSLQPILNKVVAAGILLSGCTTIITTVLIIYRIHSFSRHYEISSIKFRHIIDIVVQSGAVYAISLLIFGVSGMLSGQRIVNLKVPTYNLDLWTTTLVLPIAGISTTVMVARVSTLSENTTRLSQESKHPTKLEDLGWWCEKASTLLLESRNAHN